jgi:hypothetical protein
MKRGPRMSRRALLRGIGGLALGLPLLDAMRRTDADAETPAPPPRYVLTFGAFSLCCDHGTEPSLLLPEGLGAGYALHPTASGLADLRDQVQWVSGLTIPRAGTGELPPPGGRHRDTVAFHQHLNPMLAGMRQYGDARSMVVTGPTTDQAVADVLGANTLLRSLHLRGQVLDYAPGQAPNCGVMAHRRVGEEIVGLQPYTSPRQVFDLLTSGIVPSDPQEAARLSAALASRRSVLDFVDLRLGGLLPKLSQSDQARLERHWDALRDVERRLDLPPPPETATCTPPRGWYEDPPVDPSGDSGEAERVRRFHELIRYAFACDLTRVVTLQYTHFLSMLSASVAGLDPRPMHDIVHFGPRETLADVITWHVDQYADLLRLLRDTGEGEASLLDHSAVAFLPEGGFGYFDDMPTQTHTHATEEMLAIVAGRAGGLTPGGHVRAPTSANHPVHVLTGMMRAVGLNVDGHGEVQGHLSALFEG